MAIDFPIVDPHVHLWDPRTTPRAVSPFVRLLGKRPALLERVMNRVMPQPVRDFLGRGEYMLTSHLPEQLRDAAVPLRIETLVHVEAGWAGFDGPVGETRWLNALPFEPAGMKLGAIVGHVSLSSKRAAQTLDAHARASDKLRGIRDMASHHASARVMRWNRKPHLYRDAAFLRGFEQLATRNLRFDAWVYSNQLADVAELALRFPQTPIVLDHLGTPVGAGGPVADVGRDANERAAIVAAWRDDLARVAEHPNVHAKISGLAMPVLGFAFHTRPTPPDEDELVDRFAPFVRHALQIFGVSRCFFASNFPMDKVSAPYPTIFGAFGRLAAEHGAGAPRALLRDNALRFYGISG